MRNLDDFDEIWLADFEFGQPPGERPKPLCLVAREYRTGETLRMWEDELRRYRGAPFRTDSKTVMVAYVASAELSCFLALGWEFPTCVLDLYAEFRLLTSGRPSGCGNGLLGALAYFGLQGGVDVFTKDEMRMLAQSEGPFSSREQSALLNYCETDVVALAQLLPEIERASHAMPLFSLADREKYIGQALQRGEYMKGITRMEWRGVPIDVPTMHHLQEQWQLIELELIERIDRDFGVYDGNEFDTFAFIDYLQDRDITWPRLQGGRLRLDKQTFKDMATTFPQLAPLHELRATLGQMREWKLTVGSDGRNRCMLSPFGTITGRNTPSANKFIFALTSWLRSLIRPDPGTALAYIDFEQQEFAIAAYLSGDVNMMNAYQSGDPYLSFAKQAGAVPAMATKRSHGHIRDQFKVCSLGIQYSMGEYALAQRLGAAAFRARELMGLHRETYPTYWQWSEACVSYAMLHGYLTSTFGWRVQVTSGTRPTTLRNFLLQANGAEMLRLACILASERGLPICCPIHDAVLVEAPLDKIDCVVAETQQAMREASELVLPGFPLRTDVQVVSWPHRFTDKRGVRMWQTVSDLLNRSSERRPSLRESDRYIVPSMEQVEMF